MNRKFSVALAAFVALTGLGRSASAANVCEAEGAAWKKDKSPCNGGAGHCLKIGTLAPRNSLWGNVFNAWREAVAKDSSCGLELQFFYNGIAGDEPAMIAKMRNKQLDGAAVTARGLSQVWPHINAFQLPGMFSTWSKLDSARNQLLPEINAEFEKKGFRLVGMGDVGIAHIMTKGAPIRVPDDIKAHKPYYVNGDQVGQALLRIAGASGSALEVPGILPALKNGTADVVSAPALASDQLQWTGEMASINTMPVGIGIGGLVFYTGQGAKLTGDPATDKDALTQAEKDLLKATGKNTGELLTQRVRGADEAAFNAAAGTPDKPGKLTAYRPTPDDLAKWKTFFNSVQGAVCGSSIDKAFCDKVRAAAQ
jgi:TRAP-type C4-dicarboxylate transport system substrate-binding protein